MSNRALKNLNQDQKILKNPKMTFVKKKMTSDVEKIQNLTKKSKKIKTIK